MHRPIKHARALLCMTAGIALCIAVPGARAQDTPTPTTAPSTSGEASPNPYYLGAGLGFTHGSNVYRIPSGPGDNYLSTSVFGGFDQPISRQRIFGRGNVSYHHYQDQSQLNNTSYDIAAGADLQTIENISGNLNVGFSQYLSSPGATVSQLNPVKNQTQTERIDGRLRWGGPSLLSVEGTLGYVRLDYSEPQFAFHDSRQTSTSLGLYYQPGVFLRLGVAGRFTRTETPNALFDPIAGTFLSNTADGNNLDLLADYQPGAFLRTNARLSYTTQRNSGASQADFSGWTGSLGVTWSPTGRTSVQFDASRVAGFDANSFAPYSPVLPNSPPPVTAQYQNNRVTNAAGLRVNYAATAKIGVFAGLRYSRADIVSTLSLAPDAALSTDTLKSASLGANYAITRGWDLGCNVAHEARDVSGTGGFTYTANTAGCSAQFTWR